MEPGLVALLNQTVTVTPRSGVGLYGNPTYATGVEVACRIQSSDDLVRNLEGQEVPIRGRLYFDGDPGIAIGDRIVFADGSTPVVAAVNTEIDVDGSIHHTRVDVSG